MSGMPLHPLVVHFPIVLVVLLPISAGVALWAIRRGASPRRAWAAPLAVAAAVTLSALVATRSGRAQEDRVERVVSDRSLHQHVEAAERFLVLSSVLLLVAATGLARGTLGQAARLVTLAGAMGVAAAGAQVGHTGKLLVYRDGAASAYAAGAPAAGAEATSAHGGERR